VRLAVGIATGRSVRLAETIFLPATGTFLKREANGRP
jgi:hypothetical protein